MDTKHISSLILYFHISPDTVNVRTINHMTMSFVVMLGHVYFSGMRPVGPGCVSGQDTLLKLPSTNHVCFCSL